LETPGTNQIFLVGVCGALDGAFERARAGAHAFECRRVESELFLPERLPQFSLIVMQIRGSDPAACERVQRGLRRSGVAPLVVIADRLRAATVVQLVRSGVTDVIDLATETDDPIARALGHLGSARDGAALAGLVGESKSMRAVREQLAAVAGTRSTVLLLGETGTGKGLVARALHDHSPTAGMPFVHVDCAALAPSVIESELFGHERGAFTGAQQQHRGRFELADRGTLFLDEVGELDVSLQAKLLRALQDRAYERVGSTSTLALHARIVAATNRDLAAAARAGSFRSDLYYRLNVFGIRMPALRERLDDVPLLVRSALPGLSARLGLPEPVPTPGFIARLMRYPWPGNVRELLNTLERCVVERRPARLEAEHLDGLLEAPAEAWTPSAPAAASRVRDEGAQRSGDGERSAIAETLRITGGNVSRAARRLGIPRSTLRYKLRSYDLEGLIPED
jgi:two-component system, NtrC family, response regulator HydG